VLRRRLFGIAWALAWPLRTYLRLTPAHRGRGLVEAALVRLVLPLAPATFVTSLPGGGTIALRYRERIGLSTLLYGAFEAAEVELLRGLAVPGTTAIDAGANVGVFTIPLALSVGPGGRVLAFEPAAETADRLRENLHRNNLENVGVVEAALGAHRGTTRLSVAEDSAYSSTGGAGATGVEVPVERLDDVWDDAGRPQVSVLKIDVEGSEADVLAGAADLLRAARPAVLVESAEPERAEIVARLLGEHGYRAANAPGVQSWNRLFLADEGDQPTASA
jgi:FkbM family methyltransferase